MFAISHKSLSMMNKLTSDSVKEEDFISEAIFDRLSPTRLQKNLNFIAKFPHTTGQKGQSNDNIIKNWIEEQLGDHDKMNFHVEEKTYEVMLSYPTAKNKVSLENTSKYLFYAFALSFNLSNHRDFNAQQHAVKGVSLSSFANCLILGIRTQIVKSNFFLRERRRDIYDV